MERMNISDKTRKALEKIGLTSYEIRTFAASTQIRRTNSIRD